MDLHTLAGMVTIIGSILFIFAGMPMSNIYGEKRLEDRLARINANRRAFVVSQMGYGLGALITALGLLLFSLDTGDDASIWLNYGAAAALVIGAGLWTVFIYQRTVDPETMFGDYLGSRPMWAYFILTEIALALYGFVFLQSDTANWLGYASFITVAGMAVGALTIPEWLPPQVLYLLTLIIGVTVL
jgi:hypothetical protein